MGKGDRRFRLAGLVGSAKNHPSTMDLSAWSPLKNPLFRALWIASLTSNLGTWMQNVGGVWLMTSLTDSSLLIALMQTATSLPVFLVGLPAGALADIVDRRRLLLIWQGWMLAVALALGIATLLNGMTPALMLSLTFAMGLGAAMNGPAWQALVGEVVSRPELPTAIALNGVGFNLARTVGPALGGALVAVAGPAAVFLLNALSFVGVMWVLYRWQRPPQQSPLPAERLVGAIRAGMRYVRHAPVLQAVLIRAAAFIGSASALWALLPLVARQQLQLDASGYGVLLGCMGVGAVMAGVLLPKIRQQVAADSLVIGAAVICAIAFFVIARVPNFWLVCVMLALTGAGWTASMSSLNAATQTSVPRWVQARALGIYQLVFQGGMAIGSAFWGLIAQHFGVAIALMGAAVGLLLGLLTAIPYRLTADQLDLSPSHHWSEPIVMVELRSEDGPVLVTVEYRIDPMRAKEFVEALHDISLTRRRDGAIRWGLFFDTADPERYLETYVVESWAEHLRQHDRITVADRQASAHLLNYLVETPPKVTHLVYAHDRPEPWLGLPGLKRAE